MRNNIIFFISKIVEKIKFHLFCFERNLIPKIQFFLGFRSKEKLDRKLIIEKNILSLSYLKNYICSYFYPSETGISYAPYTDSKKYQKKEVKLNPINAYLLEDIFCETSSNVFFQEKNKKKYIIYANNDKDIPRFLCKYNRISRIGSHYLVLNRNKNIKVLDKGIYFNGNGTLNYYHWLIEILPMINFINQLDEKYKSNLLVDESLFASNNLVKTLSVLKKEREIILLEHNTTYKVEKFICFSSFETCPFKLKMNDSYKINDFKLYSKNISFIRNSFFDYFNIFQKPKYNKKFFIARKNSRRKYNQSEIIEVFNKENFEIIYFENLSLIEQIELFYNAKFIVGPTGAEWTNLVFSNKKCKGLIWMDKSLGDFCCYSNIAKFVGMDLHCLQYETKSKDITKSYNENYYIDKNKVKNLYDKVIKNEKN